ncbi:DNA polymerase III subunit delta [Sphingomonas cannabina]|uniref:DNA polymerase III subunit delta n=1 Tax=Sphingomonas cannabina TaxID=2899123 RepID=UPI001F2BB764|nr:DNA polymerase III subunit delta [Sphingomonas cannabina]UIJ45732.1 DNA polymerase III subunit delta [Sphingomonas cannabina]
MKANAAQIGSAIDRAGNGGDIRLFLLHGPDEAGAMDYAERLGRAMGQAERVDLDGPTLKSQPGRLADEAASMSLFGDKRWVRVTGMGEESAEAIQLLLDAPTAGNPVVAIAPGAKATGKLVKAAIAASNAMALACYPPEGQNAARLAAGIAREHGLRLIGDTAMAMFDAAGGDRAVLTREIEKLALYLDAAPDRPRDADADALAAIGANFDEAEMATAIEATIDGRPADLGRELAALAGANMEIPMLRALARRLVTLAEMRGEVDAGASPDTVVERHRVFWKEKSGTLKALRKWDTSQLAAALERVRRAERGVMAGGGTVGSVGAAHDLLTIARAAARL